MKLLVLALLPSLASTFVLPSSQKLFTTHLHYSNYRTSNNNNVQDPESFYWGEYDAATPRENDPVASAYSSLSLVGQMFPAENLSLDWKTSSRYDSFSTLSGLPSTNGMRMRGMSGSKNGGMNSTMQRNNNTPNRYSQEVPSNGRSVDEFLAQQQQSGGGNRSKRSTSNDMLLSAPRRSMPNVVPQQQQQQYSRTSGMLAANSRSNDRFVSPQEYHYYSGNKMQNFNRNSPSFNRNTPINFGLQDPSKAASLNNSDGSMGGSVKTGFAFAATNGFQTRPPASSGRNGIASGGLAPDAADMERSNSRIGLFGNDDSNGSLPPPQRMTTQQPSNHYGASESLFVASPSSNDFFFPAPSGGGQQRRLAASSQQQQQPIDLSRKYDGKVDNFFFKAPREQNSNGFAPSNGNNGYCGSQKTSYQSNGMSSAQPRPQMRSGGSAYRSYDDKPSGAYSNKSQYYDKYDRSPQQLKGKNNMQQKSFASNSPAPPSTYQSYDDPPLHSNQFNNGFQQQQNQHQFQSTQYQNEQNQFQQQQQYHFQSRPNGSSAHSIPPRPNTVNNKHLTPSSPRRYGIDNVHTNNSMSKWKDRLLQGTSEAVEKIQTSAGNVFNPSFQ